MKKIFLTAVAICTAFTFSGCSDFLDKTPDKSGSAYIYHMDQLYGLMGSLDLYFFGYPDELYVSWSFLNYYMQEQSLMNDAIDYSVEQWANGMSLIGINTYLMYSWKPERLMRENLMNATWTPSWDRIYTFNTVLEYLDKVIQTTPQVRSQVEGEARFGRAYYHFLLLTQYCLWDENAPGIGYRDDTQPNEVPARQTVGYTLSRIYEDLTLAEEALRSAGRTEFEFENNLRPTIPTLQAFRARVELYRGNYDAALKDATAALEAHNTLLDFKNDPMYALSASTEYYLLDEDLQIESVLTSMVMTDINNREAQAIAVLEELYLPSMSSQLYGGEFAPMARWHYDLFDKDNDARWLHFYRHLGALRSQMNVVQSVVLNGDTEPTPNCIKWEDRQWLKPEYYHSYKRFNTNGKSAILGMTTAEMYLIKAECLARAGQTGDAAAELRTLRKARFLTEAAADDVTGTVQEVLDERLREMTSFWRFWDIKRLNGAENAGISVRHEILSDPYDVNSARVQLEITPDDGRWALPFYTLEAELMGWQQNTGWE